MSILSWFLPELLPTGFPAPEFTLTTDDGQSVSLASLRGRNVVLIFYPGDDTTVCRRQLCEFRDHWQNATARNVAVFGVNPQSASSHERFRQKFALPCPLLVDFGQKVAKLYRASGLIVRRTVYLIGPDGVIRYAQRGKPAPDEVLAAAL
jgi:peroxiredoxin Q/BCP